MKGFLSKVFVLVFFLFSTFYFLSSPAIAKASQITPNPTKTATVSSTVNSDVPNNLHNWTQTVMIEVMSTLSCQLTGIDPITPNHQCLGVDQKTGKIGFLPAGDPEKGQIGGAIGGMTNMITMLYTPPLHTSDYFQNLAQNFGINKKAYAEWGKEWGEGRGYGELSPLIKIWGTFRNIVYSLLVVVMIVLGLGIMLRLNIDPRTVMSIQNQIPKIIVGIFLVTFSFAIAGFLVDLMWISTYAVTNTLSQGGADGGALINGKTPFAVIESYGGLGEITGKPATSGRELLKEVLDIDTSGANYIPFISFIPSLLDIIKDLPGTLNTMITNPGSFFTMTSINGNIGDSPTDYIINAMSKISSVFAFVKVMDWSPIKVSAEGGWNFVVKGTASIDTGSLLNIPFAGIFSAAAYSFIQLVMREILPWLIIWIILTIALFVALIRLWFTLIMTYVMILIDVVLAPFWIIAGILPGSSISFSAWLRDIAANLLAFPAVIFMFLLGKIFMDGFGASDGGGFMPPLIGDTADPELFGPLIAIGIILMTPNVVNMLKQALKAPKIDTGIGKAFAPGLAVPGRTTSGVGGLIFGNTMEKGFIDSKKPGVERSALGRFARILGIAPR